MFKVKLEGKAVVAVQNMHSALRRTENQVAAIRSQLNQLVVGYARGKGFDGEKCNLNFQTMEIIEVKEEKNNKKSKKK